MTVIDPRQIHTQQELAEQLIALFDRGGWSIHSLAEKAELGPATVHAIIARKTKVPQAKTLVRFVRTCGKKDPGPWLEDLGPWLEARGRVQRSYKMFEQAEVLTAVHPEIDPEFAFIDLEQALTLPKEPVDEVVSLIVRSVRSLRAAGRFERASRALELVGQRGSARILITLIEALRIDDLDHDADRVMNAAGRWGSALVLAELVEELHNGGYWPELHRALDAAARVGAAPEVVTLFTTLRAAGRSNHVIGMLDTVASDRPPAAIPALLKAMRAVELWDDAEYLQDKAATHA